MIGLNAKFYVGTGTDLAAATFTKAGVIAHLTSIGDLTLATDEVETTDLDSVGFKEFEPTLSDYGSIEIEGNIKGTNFETVKALVTKDASGNVVKKPFAIAHPSEDTINGKFMGWVSEFTRGAMTPGDLVTFKATIRISGKIEDFTEPVA